jgi:hypothetical protein
MRQGIVVLAIASLVGVKTASAARPKLKTEEEKPPLLEPTVIQAGS